MFLKRATRHWSGWGTNLERYDCHVHSDENEDAHNNKLAKQQKKLMNHVMDCVCFFPSIS